MEYQKLYRSRTNRTIAGVAGGLGEFFIIDPVIIRIIFVILALMGGGGFLIYILLWIFVPYRIEENYSAAPPPPTNPHPPQEETKEHPHSRSTFFGGVILITLGILFLADRMIPEINFHQLWPVILIVIGLLLLGSSFKRKTNNWQNKHET